jgi:hypothetical protein
MMNAAKSAATAVNAQMIFQVRDINPMVNLGYRAGS